MINMDYDTTYQLMIRHPVLEIYWRRSCSTVVGAHQPYRNSMAAYYSVMDKVLYDNQGLIHP